VPSAKSNLQVRRRGDRALPAAKRAKGRAIGLFFAVAELWPNSSRL